MPARISRSRVAVAMFCAALLAGANSAHTQIADTPDLETMASAAQISVSGIINDVSGTDLWLRFGKGEIIVDLAGWDGYGHGRAGQPLLGIGDRVTVTGPVADLHDERRLKPQTIYVEDRDTFYTTTWPDGEAWAIRHMPIPPLYGGDPVTVKIAGQVAGIEDGAVSLDIGGSALRVTLQSLIDNPLDDVGRRRIQVGDWIQVGADLDESFFRERRLDAVRINRIVAGGADTL